MSILANNKTQQYSAITVPTLEGYGVEIHGDQLALQESFADQLEIIKAIHAHDVHDVQGAAKGVTESADFQVTLEATMSGVWEKIKKFFRDLWAKLKAFFASVVRWFDGIVKSGSDFVKKYEKELRNLNLSGFEYKLYKYSNIDNFTGLLHEEPGENLVDSALDAASQANGKAVADLKAEIEKQREGKEDALNQVRGEMVGASGSLTAEEFSKELFGHFRSGAKGPEDKVEGAITASHILDTIKDTKGKKTVEDIAKKTDQGFAKSIKAIDDLERKLGNVKNGEGGSSEYNGKRSDGSETKLAFGSSEARQAVIEALHLYSSMTSATKEIAMAGFRAWREAYAERESEYKKAAIAAFRYKAKK